MTNFTPNEHFYYYLWWIGERQSIFWHRYNGDPAPYTDDKILQTFKFTNVYRVLDRTSQYMLSNVIYNGNTYSRPDMLWRILIFKHFNSPTTWRYLIHMLGDVTFKTPTEDIIQCVSDLKDRGYAVYSNAYMLTASFMKSELIKKRWGIAGADRKHVAYLRLFDNYIRNNGLYNKILQAWSFQDVFELLRTVPTVGNFLAYQYVQDWNYSPIFDFNDNEFCSAGYGTIRGIERVFDITGTPDYGEIVKWTYTHFEELLYNYGLADRFRPLPGRRPQVADLSNCFCETDKYLRQAGIKTSDKTIHGKRMKNVFNPDPDKIEYTFPPKWKIKL